MLTPVTFEEFGAKLRALTPVELEALLVSAREHTTFGMVIGTMMSKVGVKLIPTGNSDMVEAIGCLNSIAEDMHNGAPVSLYLEYKARHAPSADAYEMCPEWMRKSLPQ
jgi:hypothetical protein